MALSTDLRENSLAKRLEKLPPALVSTLKAGALSGGEAARTLPTGFPAIDQQLPGGGLLTGALVEFAVAGAASLATTLGLAACRSAQRAAEQLGGAVPWCAFIDPSRSLYAPGVAHAGVQLDRLLVVRPSLSLFTSSPMFTSSPTFTSSPIFTSSPASGNANALARVALRVVESQCFAVVVIDTVGVPGAELNVPLGSWPRIVRRMALALQETQSTAILITDSTARRPLTLPVAQRIELERSQAHKLILQVAKDRQGRVSAPVSIDFAMGRTADFAMRPQPHQPHQPHQPRGEELLEGEGVRHVG